MQIALDSEVYETVSEQGQFYEIRVPDKNASGFVLKGDTVPWKDQVKDRYSHYFRCAWPAGCHWSRCWSLFRPKSQKGTMR